MVRRAPGQVSGSLIITRPDLSCGATFLPEDLTFAPLVLSLPTGDRGFESLQRRDGIGQAARSQSSWLVAGVLPSTERQPRKKLEPSAERLLSLLHRWRDEAVRAGKKITRTALAFEAGRDGFWLARWLSARGVEARIPVPSQRGVRCEPDF
jgi:hypothetical protein